MTSGASSNWSAHPQVGWKARGDYKLEEKRRPLTSIRWRQSIEYAGLGLRYMVDYVANYSRRHKRFINAFDPMRHKPIYGVPCGGIGTGGIGRDFRGGFCKFSLRPGIVEQDVSFVPADQFIITIRKSGKTVFQKVLCAKRKKKCFGALSAWHYGIAASKIQYTGLYPRSWTTYDIPEHNLRLTCTQISPVIPHNYKDASLPVTVFTWRVEYLANEKNRSEPKEPMTVVITFTFGDHTSECGERHHAPSVSRSPSAQETLTEQQTGLSLEKQAQVCRSRLFDTDTSKGVLLSQYIGGMQCTYGLATSASSGHDITRCLRFDPSRSGKALWRDLYQNGVVTLGYDGLNPQFSNRLGIALSVKLDLHEKNEFTSTANFVLTWDMPMVQFGQSARVYRRRYTRHFGHDGDCTDRLADYALQQLPSWHSAIDEWQWPVLHHESLPDWYKSALFNELYYLTDGGSVWLDFDPEWRSMEPSISDYTADVLAQYGRFAYLESFEYRMLNTYDVHFYSSSALAQLFPFIEQSIHADFCDQIPRVVQKRIKYFIDGHDAPAKVMSRVPHDLGNPFEDPYTNINAYPIHNTDDWRDLNLKWVLATYRNLLQVVDSPSTSSADSGATPKAMYSADMLLSPHSAQIPVLEPLPLSLSTAQMAFLSHCWPAVTAIMEAALREWDTNNDGMIENCGHPDQTYDAWTMTGVSAYCGSLWLASLQASRRMAALIQDQANEQHFEVLLASARQVFIDKLWTGDYYKFDEEARSKKRDVVMADQLCGVWFLGTCRFDDAIEILPPMDVLRALSTIFSTNVMSYKDGKYGAVNGVISKTNRIDKSSLQSEEVWTGTTYALAAFMLQRGQVHAAFKTASGIYEQCWRRIGLQYQTPEALHTAKPIYRAIGYMRPLAIWAMQHALDKQHHFPALDSKLFPKTTSTYHTRSANGHPEQSISEQVLVVHKPVTTDEPA